MIERDTLCYTYSNKFWVSFINTPDASLIFVLSLLPFSLHHSLPVFFLLFSALVPSLAMMETSLKWVHKYQWVHIWAMCWSLQWEHHRMWGFADANLFLNGEFFYLRSLVCSSNFWSLDFCIWKVWFQKSYLSVNLSAGTAWLDALRTSLYILGCVSSWQNEMIDLSCI